MKNILLVGATGYLGQHVARELKDRNYTVKIVVRSTQKVKQFDIPFDELVVSKMDTPLEIENMMDGIDCVISTLGITKQKDGLTYMDVDFNINLKFLNAAVKSNIKKFIYVSALNGEKLKNLKIFEAKEMLVDKIKQSGISHTILRPNGFFSDVAEIYNMAKSGRVYLLNNGNCLCNPIHGSDLAKLCVDSIDMQSDEIEVGGPDILSHNDIAKLAFDVINKEAKISYLPNWSVSLVKVLLKLFTKQTFYGPFEFFLTVMSMDMLAPKYGTKTLEQEFCALEFKHKSQE